MKNTKSVPIKETLILTLGEAICSLIVCAVFLLIKKFDYTVLLGTVIGSVAIILNFLFMSIKVNSAIDQAFMLRDNYVDEPSSANGTATDVPDAESTAKQDAEGSEDDAQEKLDAAMRFANEQSVRVNRIAKISYIIRMATLITLLVVALISKWFHPLATVIPMLMFRPIIMAEGLIRSKSLGGK